MAIELLDEHEQGERVRQWLRDNGSAIIGGIALGLALIFGWQWYDRSQQEKRVTAAVQYQALADAIEREDAESVQSLAGALQAEYGGTPYAHMAALALADQQLERGELDAAAATLEQVRSGMDDPAMAALAGLRLARVRLAQGNPEQALALAQGVATPTWAGLAGELEGDALVALGRGDEARSAYQDALQALDTAAPTRSIIEMKLAAVGGSAEAEGATPGADSAAGDA